jgi:hypothetical protein
MPFLAIFAFLLRSLRLKAFVFEHAHGNQKKLLAAKIAKNGRQGRKRHRAIEAVPFKAPPAYGANLVDTAVVISAAFRLKYSHNSREALVLLRASRNTELHSHGRTAA